jgi:SAM-dependent methyltransferase
MKKIDKIFHQQKYKLENNKNFDEILKNKRIKIFDFFQKKFKKNFYGNILDLGSGNGYASVYLSKNFNLKKIISLEGSKYAAQVLLPSVFKYFNLKKKITIQHSDFTKIDKRNYFDFVISFGSLHHSSCLFSTMRSISKAMKNNSYLICHEPISNKYTTNDFFQKKYNSSEKKYGLIFKNKERDDHFFRESEYLVAGYHNNLDLVYMKKYNITDISLLLNIKMNVKKFIRNKIFKKKNIGDVNDYILIFKKGKKNIIPPHLFNYQS